MKIGFFDSGLGGLTVFNKVMKNIKADYIYLADNKNSPYGIKTKKEVVSYAKKNVQTLVDIGCEIIVIACNTATSVAIDDLRKMYKNICIIGIEPAVKVAVCENNLSKKIFVSATTMTLKEKKLNELIKKLGAENMVEKIALDKLVKFAESGDTSNDEVERYLENKFKDYDLNQYSHLVLGCTHFPLFKDQIKKVLKNNIKVIDGSDGIVKNLKTKIINKGLAENDIMTVSLLLTKESNTFVENFKRISGIENVAIEVIN